MTIKILFERKYIALTQNENKSFMLTLAGSNTITVQNLISFGGAV